MVDRGIVILKACSHERKGGTCSHMLHILLEISRDQTFPNLVRFQLLVIDLHEYLTHVHFTAKLFLQNSFREISNRTFIFVLVKKCVSSYFV